jgi:hypothetical protein
VGWRGGILHFGKWGTDGGDHTFKIAVQIGKKSEGEEQFWKERRLDSSEESGRSFDKKTE